MSFWDKIKQFNLLYNMPKVGDPYDRIPMFQSILSEELREGEDIAAKVGLASIWESNYDKMDMRVDMADWLGDLLVYCASEAVRWDLPIEQIVDIIMESNFSKMGADGKPIYDERGKLLKGENYWKPEPKIRVLLEKLDKEFK